MTDKEVALELTKLVLSKGQMASYSTEQILELYSKCLAFVREKQE